MNEHEEAITNLWIAVLYAGIDDALKGWKDSIDWLMSNDFKEVCSYTGIDPEFAMSLYHKQYKEVQVKTRADIYVKKQLEITDKCEICNIEIKFPKKKMCSDKCAEEHIKRYNKRRKERKNETSNNNETK